MFITEHIDFIKSQIAYHERSVEYFGDKKDYKKLNRHSGILRRLREILQVIEDLVANPPPPQAVTTTPEKIGSRLGDISKLPESIRKQLVSAQVDEQEQNIINIIRDEFGGMASVDEIFVQMYLKHQFDKDREFLARKIYRMTRGGAIYSVPKKKGIYSIAPPQKVGKAADKKPEKVNQEDLIGHKSAHGAG